MMLIKHFERTISLFGEGGLNESFFKETEDNLQAISGKFNITTVQAALLAILIENEPIETVKLSGVLNCKKIELYQYMDDLDVLVNKKLIKRFMPTSFSRHDSPFYTVPVDLITAIRKGTEYKDTTYENMTPEGFFDIASEIINALEEDDLSMEDSIFETSDLVRKNQHICFVKKSLEYGLEDHAIFLLFVFCCELVKKNENTINAGKLGQIFGSKRGRKLIDRFESKEHILTEKELIENVCINGIADNENFRLTNKAKDEFLADIDLKVKYKKNDIIHPDTITCKKLIYNKNILGRVRELSALLGTDNFEKIQMRLAEKGLRRGFACLFSGPPGTGKTETAYQIAKETGRGIYLVDIAETKNMWFGESEKRIKAIFNRYHSMVKSEPLAPILLFNEADAVFGKRQVLQGGKNGPGQTENAIQNIILQEIENLNGILIATTNMTINFDKAFERRFLYKIVFDKPDTESKKKIWKNYIPDLNSEEAVQLAKKFDLSGGQIENIMRKNEVSFILKGQRQSFERLEALCEQEYIEKAKMRIGFGA